MNFILVLSLCLLSCHGYKARLYEPVDRGDYGYQRINDGEVIVMVRHERYLKEALLAIGCEKEYVCIVGKDAERYIVQQRKK